MYLVSLTLLYTALEMEIMFDSFTRIPSALFDSKDPVKAISSQDRSQDRI